jgi:hypothetical protein
MAYDGYWKHLTPTIVAMHKGGSSPVAIAELLDHQLSSQVVRYILQKEGVYISQARPNAKLRCASAFAMREQGYTLDKIAAELGVTRERARQMTAKHARLRGVPYAALSARYELARQLKVKPADLERTAEQLWMHAAWISLMLEARAA